MQAFTFCLSLADIPSVLIPQAYGYRSSIKVNRQPYIVYLELALRIRNNCTHVLKIVKQVGQQLGHPARFLKIYSNGFAASVSKKRQYKGYCLISNESDSWKCALDYWCIFFFNMASYMKRKWYLREF